MSSDKLYQKKKFRKIKEFARQKAKQAPYETIKIICEGETETKYFKKIINFFRLNTANVDIAVGKGSAPISIIEHGLKIAKTQPDIDRIVCVFDRDDHESYHRATQKFSNKPNSTGGSKLNGPICQSITSTPSFEIWLLLHFCYTTKPYVSSGNKSAADHVIMELQKYCQKYRKNTIDWFESLIVSNDNAIKNAKRLKEDNDRTGSTNPATDIHELIELLKNLKNNSIA